MHLRARSHGWWRSTPWSPSSSCSGRRCSWDSCLPCIRSACRPRWPSLRWRSAPGRCWPRRRTSFSACEPSMSSISVEDLSIRFRIYHDRSPSLKDYVVGLVRPKKQAAVSDFWAINHVSFRIAAGERVGIVRHNGAGKSTLLKALCRIYEPTSGQVAVRGRIVALLELGAGFHPEFAGRENIYLNGAIVGYSKSQLRAIEQEVIDLAEIEEFIDTPVKYYSTGMYLRLAFALATAVQPEILILDEM